MIEAVTDLRILEKIRTEFFPLVPDPCQWKPGSQMDICFLDGMKIQLPCNGHQCQEIIVPVQGFVWYKFLVAFPNPVINAVIFQNISGKDRL